MRWGNHVDVEAVSVSDNDTVVDLDNDGHREIDTEEEMSCDTIPCFDSLH